MRDFKITDAKGGAAFGVRVVPRASKSEIVGIMDDGALKIRLTAPAVDGKANEALIALLADALNCKRDQIEIVVGHTSKGKLISVIGVTPDQINALVKQDK